MLAVAVTIALAAAVIVLFAWSPWAKPTELEWLGRYESWSEGVEASLAAGAEVSRAACESAYDDEVGSPPNERLEPVSTAARRGCAAPSPEGWQNAEADVVRALMAAHGALVPPRERRDFAEIASSAVGGRAKVYCWRPEAWAPFFPQYALVRGGEEVWAKGIADTARNRIDLDPGICAALGRYLRRIRPPALSYQNFELAEALVVLTHEAGHLKAPSVPQATLACYAVQHVRPLVLAAGWGPRFATEIALHAWDLAYARLPSRHRTPACRDGGPLDRNPSSSAWP